LKNGVRIIWPVIILLGIGLTVGGVAVKNRQRGFILGVSHTIGDNLITFTNSAHLDRIQPELQVRLSELLSAPTQVASVLMGDVPQPVGDGRAYSHIVLTNNAGKQLLIRLQPTGKPGMFRVLGFHQSRGVQ
jgi:hypothetical protein